MPLSAAVLYQSRQSWRQDGTDDPCAKLIGMNAVGGEVYRIRADAAGRHQTVQRQVNIRIFRATSRKI